MVLTIPRDVALTQEALAQAEVAVNEARLNEDAAKEAVKLYDDLLMGQAEGKNEIERKAWVASHKLAPTDVEFVTATAREWHDITRAYRAAAATRMEAERVRDGHRRVLQALYLAWESVTADKYIEAAKIRREDW